MYGQTEATARMGYLPAGEALNRCGSMGIAIPEGNSGLTGEDGREIKEAGTTGELVYEGKNVMLGYAKTGATCQREMNAEGFFSPETWQDVMRQVLLYRREEKGFSSCSGTGSAWTEPSAFETSFWGCDFACTGNDEGMKIFHGYAEGEYGFAGALCIAKAGGDGDLSGEGDKAEPPCI